MVGGLKTSILQKMERFLMPAEAKARGYMEDPEVLFKVDKKIEELMVTSLYGEVVTVEEKVNQQDVDAYWAKYSDRHRVPERRTGRLVIAADRAEAEAARAELEGGAAWGDIVQRYGTDPTNKSRSGKLDEVTDRATGPVPEALFAIPEGEIGPVFDVGDGRWGVVRCDRILPGEAPDPMKDRDALFAAIRAQRKEDLFQELLAQWADEFGVTRHDENLEHVKSWKELTYVEPVGEPVPRS
jgi:parvulin-like peptidyl-prolyl isomerase